MAAPAGWVMKPCSGSRVPAPDGSLASASRYGFPGSSPVTAASNTCTSPWSDSETLVGALSSFFADGGDDHHPGHRRVLFAAHSRYGIGDVHECLWSLADRTGRDHLVLQRVDCGYLVLVLEADIDPRAIAGWPDAVR